MSYNHQFDLTADFRCFWCANSDQMWVCLIFRAQSKLYPVYKKCVFATAADKKNIFTLNKANTIIN